MDRETTMKKLFDWIGKNEGVAFLSKEDEMNYYRGLVEVYEDLLTSYQHSLKEDLQAIHECLVEIKELEVGRMNEAARQNKAYDASITSWAKTAEKYLSALLEK